MGTPNSCGLPDWLPTLAGMIERQDLVPNDLTSDPQEHWNLFEADERLDARTEFRNIGTYEESLDQYPKIWPGRGFGGDAVKN